MNNLQNLLSIEFGGYITLIVLFLTPIFIFLSLSKMIIRKMLFLMTFLFSSTLFMNNQYFIFAINFINNHLQFLPIIFILYIIFGTFNGLIKFSFTIISALFYIVFIIVLIHFASTLMLSLVK